MADRSRSSERSDSWVAGEKRSSVEFGEQDEIACKRVKMRDLESSSRPDGIGTDGGHFLENEKDGDVDQFDKEGMLQIGPGVALNVGGSEEEQTDKKYDGSLDLNNEAAIANNSCSHDHLDDAENCRKQSSLVRDADRRGYNNCTALEGVGLDLNVEDVSSSANLQPSKNQGHIKSRDISECGSTTGSLEDNEPLRRWKEMKENGFLSASYGGKQSTKQRVRRSKAEIIKKKIEVAKREQVDRFTKIAAPSGLLNELNPGIINHVRNRKQVHSIIESLVRSEKLENDHCGSKQTNHLKSQGNEIINWKESESMNDSGTSRFGFSRENNYLHTLSESKQVRVCPMPVDTFIPQEKSGDDNSSTFERVYGRSCARDSTENDTLLLKLSPAENGSENAGSFSNEESGNLSSVSSITVKAATVASQWLELLHQDVKGRLAALRRSKKRVRAVINTELPFLLSKEFLSNQENDPYLVKSSTEEFSVDATAEMHQARWTALFSQMDHSLSEEEKQLESWLDQVKEMQLHCNQGLHHLHWNSAFGLQQLGTLENDSRSGKTDNPEKELAVHAAAASIYSTCNYLISKENVSCF